MANDSGDHVMLILLDLTAAFDTVDHAILLDRLQHLVGINGTALDSDSDFVQIQISFTPSAELLGRWYFPKISLESG